MARLAAERVGTGGAVTGVDAHPGMLAVARSVPAEGAAIDWHHADAAATALPDAAYDAVAVPARPAVLRRPQRGAP